MQPYTESDRDIYWDRAILSRNTNIYVDEEIATTTELSWNGQPADILCKITSAEEDSADVTVTLPMLSGEPSYAPISFKVHDIENIADQVLIRLQNSEHFPRSKPQEQAFEI